VDREAFIEAYGITTDSGEFRSRAQVIATVAASLRKLLVKDAAKIATSYVDDDAFMRKHRHETAGSIAREVRRAHFGDWAV
jgi:hypothetical protein